MTYMLRPTRGQVGCEVVMTPDVETNSHLTRLSLQHGRSSQSLTNSNDLHIYTCLFSEVTTVGSSSTQALSVEHHRVCKGTDTHIGHHKSAAERYDEYKVRYTNCTMVNGNLEIVFLDDPPYDQYDLSFLNSIT